MKRASKGPSHTASILSLCLLALACATSLVGQENINGKYKVGQRVDCEFPEYGGKYRRGTIVKVQGAGSKLTCCNYRVLFDDEEPLWRDEGRLSSERAVRLQGSGSKTPKPSGRPTTVDTPIPATPGVTSCPLNKSYKKPVKNAAPSAELFKGVIFHWEAGLNKRFQDFGLTFRDFSMGKVYRNRVYPGINVRRDVDTARPGTTIYPLKTKLLTCQKDLSITIRRLWEIKYDCYKDIDGEWTCKNNAPKMLESDSIPNN